MPKVDKKKMHEFDYKKSVVIAHINNLDQVRQFARRVISAPTISQYHCRSAT